MYETIEWLLKLPVEDPANASCGRAGVLPTLQTRSRFQRTECRRTELDRQITQEQEQMKVSHAFGFTKQSPAPSEASTLPTLPSRTHVFRLSRPLTCRESCFSSTSFGAGGETSCGAGWE